MGTIHKFGPFALDERERRLTAGAEPVELTGKSFETLLHLVKSPGRLLARRELIDAVWPDAVVEEGNLHWTVSAVRKALAVHDPDTSYIETVRGFGYRFVGTVAVEDPPPGVAVPPAPAAEPARAAPPRPEARRGRVVWRTLAALLVVLAAVVVSRGAREVPRPGRRTLAVVGFRNLSGRPEDAWLATAFAEMLSADLAQGTGLRAVPGEDVARMLRELRLPEAQPPSRDALGRIARNAGADWVVSGSFVVLPGDERRLRLDARVDDTASGEIVASASRAGRESDLFELVGAVGDDLRASLGFGAVASGPGRRQALPKDPTARRAYAEGLERLRRLDARGAAPLFEQAARAAPDFAGTPLALSRALLLLGDEERAEREALRAHQLSAGLPEAERLAIEAGAHVAARRWETAIGAWTRLTALEPDVPDHALALAEAQLMGGRFQDALRTLASLRPRPVAGRDQARLEWLASTAYAQMDDHAEALAHARRAVEVAERQGAREIEVRALLRAAFSLPRAGGSLDEAIRLGEQARALALTVGDRNLLGKCLNFLGTLYSDAEDSASAERLYRESLALHRELGAHASIDSVLFNLAIEATTRGDLRAAQGWHEQELQQCRTTRSRPCEARALSGLGDNRLYRGDLDEARRLLEDALDRHRALDNRNRQAEVLSSLAEIELWRGRVESAQALFTRALALREAAGSPAARAWARLDLARAGLARGASAGARADIEALVTAAARGGRAERTLEGYARALLALVLLSSGDGDGAARESALAARLAPAPRHPAASFYVAATRARVLLARGEFEAAGRAIDAQQHAAETSGMLAYELDARLLRARLLRATGRDADATSRLRELRAEALSKGFVGLAREAQH